MLALGHSLALGHRLAQVVPGQVASVHVVPGHKLGQVVPGQQLGQVALTQVALGCRLGCHLGQAAALLGLLTAALLGLLPSAAL